MANNSLSSQIYLSRNEIKNQIIEYMQSYLELENVDLLKSSFLSFMVEVISILTSNILFYQISTYREFYLTKAQLPESILNLSAFLGYSGANASTASVNVLFTIPFGFPDANTEFTIPNGFRVFAGDVEFRTYYTTTITVTNNAAVSVTVQEGNRTFSYPVSIEDTDFAFVLPFRQFKVDEQEFKIDEDLEPFQFFEVDVPLEGQLSSLTVEIQDPGGTSFTTWTAFNSLYLMDSNDTGYVARRSDIGQKISFGNGLIGVQPPPGGLIQVTSNLTEGADGNVIAGSITTGDRIYNTTVAGITQVVDYTVINTSSASGGSDQESLEEIRSNAITSLTALDRTVTEEDYKNANVIIEGSPLGANSLPILKRSDLKTNEIVLFTTLFFNNEVVPTRNAFYTFTDLAIPRGTVITVDEIDYYTVFDMEIDTLNTVANYEYVVFELEQLPALTTTYDPDYDFILTQVLAKRDGQKAVYEVTYSSTESNAASANCNMRIVENGATYPMTNDGTNTFILEFFDYAVVPDGELTYRFDIRDSSNNLKSTYSAQFTFKKSLRDLTISNVVSDGTANTVYDIPVIKKSYYDSINQREFELEILQELMTTTSFTDYRMLTDFVSLKFGNTTGNLTNMLLNPSTLTVNAFSCEPPPTCSVGDKYLVGRGSGVWEGYDDYIATCTDATAVTWTFTRPDPDQIVLVSDENKKYIYSDSGWVYPQFNIPLEIAVDVFRSSDFSGSITDLSQDVRTAIYNGFSGRFGINAEIFSSEIIDVVQEVDGVKKCRVTAPLANIFFSYNINNFTQQELLEFGPDYIYFTEDNITVRVF